MIIFPTLLLNEITFISCNWDQKCRISRLEFLGRGATFICRFFYVSACLRVSLDKIKFMKLPLGNSGATYLRNVTDTVETVQYSESQCTQQQYWHECRRCSWLHEGLYCIAPRPFTRFVFFFCRFKFVLWPKGKGLWLV